jgi:hypothetical protein
MQHCPNCGGGELKIIVVILERPAIEKILTHLGLDPQPPPRGRAVRGGPGLGAVSLAEPGTAPTEGSLRPRVNLGARPREAAREG